MTAINLVKRKELDFATSGCIGTILMMHGIFLLFFKNFFCAAQVFLTLLY